METVCLAIVPLLLIVSVDLFSLLYYLVARLCLLKIFGKAVRFKLCMLANTTVIMR